MSDEKCGICGEIECDLQSCAECGKMFCDNCGEWCCSEYDVTDGDYFCVGCQY